MKSLRKFKHINAKTIDDAVSNLRQYGDKAWVIAGGTDLLGTMRFEVLRNYPELIINLKTIPGLDYIREEDGVLKIGAMTRLQDIAINSTAKSKYAALSEAARRTASPHIREMGTIGGNICQLIRCWYFRKEENRFDCIRKGGRMCHAVVGDNRYHSIFGAVRVAAPPCSSGCLAGVDISSYLGRIRDGDLPEAARILLDSNPLPSITGRVCPHFCEQDCNRGDYDEAISIRSIERFMGDYIFENADEMFTSPRGETQKSVAIVGSGPAGLSAAYYLRRLGHSVTVFEKMAEPGGLLTYGIPPYRLPKDIVKRQVEALKGMGIEFRLETNIGEDVSIEKLMESSDAVFLACGAWGERALGIKGEELMTSGLEFLRNLNLGIREIPGEKIAVIGGGNVAIDVARTLLRLGAEPVIIYRRSEGEMPAVKEEVNKAKREGIEIQFLTLPVEASKKGSRVVLKCARMRLGPLDETGRPQPVPIEGQEFIAEFDAAIKAIGEEPDTSTIPGEFLDERGRLKVDVSKHSLGKNVFVGGDFVTGPSTVVAAIASGRSAAGSIDKYLGGKATVEGENSARPLTRSNSAYLSKLSRVETPELPISQTSIDVEDVLGLSLSAVETEANRCFNCGCEGVNPSDMAAALVALDAKIVTSKRTVNADDFWTAEKLIKSTLLESDEIVTEIQIPAPLAGVKSAFIKFALRRSIDFPIVNCAAAIESKGGVVKSARVCLNAVYCNPYRVTKAEDFIKGKTIDEANAEAAGAAAVADAIALPYNKYKIQIAKTMVKRAILACK